MRKALVSRDKRSPVCEATRAPPCGSQICIPHALAPIGSWPGVQSRYNAAKAAAPCPGPLERPRMRGGVRKGTVSWPVLSCRLREADLIIPSEEIAVELLRLDNHTLHTLRGFLPSAPLSPSTPSPLSSLLPLTCVRVCARLHMNVYIFTCMHIRDLQPPPQPSSSSLPFVGVPMVSGVRALGSAIR